jgi:hypothetical protein
MTGACLVRVKRPAPSRSTWQLEFRVLPPMPISVVAEASSSCSDATRAAYSRSASERPCRTRHATWMWCIARIIAEEAQ